MGPVALPGTQHPLGRWVLNKPKLRASCGLQPLEVGGGRLIYQVPAYPDFVVAARADKGSLQFFKKSFVFSTQESAFACQSISCADSGSGRWVAVGRSSLMTRQQQWGQRQLRHLLSFIRIVSLSLVLVSVGDCSVSSKLIILDVSEII